ncbi:MAG: DUF2164 domain-containing protein [Alphaproteobacteria bacterium]|nr:DUF2164 domain-containing protein [Alphaproteobacteria bacterium]
MDRIAFSREEKRALVLKMRDYFDTELDQPIGDIGAELLIDFLEVDIGAFYYNKGLHDAQAAFRQQVEAFDDAVYALERPEAARGAKG